jgi:DNA-binding XRE family transcriptional regulator
MNKIKGYRAMCGLTQEEMAETLNISVTSYRLKESGVRPFTQDEMIAFLNAVRKVDSTATLDIIFLK